MKWMRMLGRFRPPQTDETLKAAAQRETERIKAQLERLGIQVELATHRRIDELERELRELSEESQ